MKKYLILTAITFIIFSIIFSGCIRNEYTLTINIDGRGSVIKYLNQSTYNYDDVVKLKIVTYPGWIFDHWSGDLTGSENPTSITINGNKIVTATFIQDNTNYENISDEIELVHHEIQTYGNITFAFKEVTGTIRKIGDAAIDHAIVSVYFYNKKNDVIFFGTYSIYSFVKGYDYDFFVQFRSIDPYYNEYNHYSIELDYI